MDNLKEKIVTINSVTNLNPEDPKPVKFKDENGDSYTVWKFKKDGNETVAFSQFKVLPYGGDGATVGIAYSEEPKSFVNQKGETVNFTQRTVMMLKKASEVRPENQVPNTPRVQPTQTAQNKKENWEDKSAFGKCKHAYLVEAFKAHLGDPNVKLTDMERIAEEWAKASMRELPTPTPLETLLKNNGIEVIPAPEGYEAQDQEIPF